jgi:hypothetical protein
MNGKKALTRVPGSKLMLCGLAIMILNLAFWMSETTQCDTAFATTDIGEPPEMGRHPRNP